MRVAEIRELYDYDSWANERLWQAVADLSPEQVNADMRNGIGGIQATLLHMANGLLTWRTRWEGGMPSMLLRPEEFATLALVRQRWDEEMSQLRRFLTTLPDDDLVRELRYVRPAHPDRVLTQPLWQTMLHVINHQTQHRSEIAMQLTSLGHSPGELGMNVYFNR